MKNQQLCLFCICLLLNVLIISNLEVKNTFNSIKVQEAPLRGYFFIQRFYPGNDPIDNVKESEFHTRQMFFELNKEMLFFSKSLEKIEDVEGNK